MTFPNGCGPWERSVPPPVLIVGDPRSGTTLKALCRRLGWRYDDAMARHDERAAERLAGHEGRTGETVGVELSREREQARQAMPHQPPGAKRIGACGDAGGARRLHILITNMQLTEGTGTEQVTRDLALHFMQRGHIVAVYSPKQGRFAARMRTEGVHLVDTPSAVGWSPDVIHGHHHVETMAALRAHPEARGLFVCHDGRQWADHPPLHPRVMRYVAVDKNCRERLASLVPLKALRVIGNWFDADRFRPRRPLPARPRRALFFSNYAGNAPALLRVLREACAAEGLRLDLLGESVGNQRVDPEAVLGGYDLVFAKGKCAIEALATGCAVIVCHERPGPLITPLNMELCRQWNFGLRLALSPLTVEAVRREIRDYDAEKAAIVSRFARERCGFTAAVSAYEQLYDEVLAEELPSQPDGESMNLERLLHAVSQSSARCRAWDAPPACGPLRLDQMRRIRLTALDHPNSFAPGSQHEVMVHVHNMSDASVSTSAPAPVQLSFQWELDGVKVSHDRASPRTPLPGEIPPGASMRLPLRVIAPLEPGIHRLRMTCVQEGVAWFDLVAPETACFLTIGISC